MPIVREIVEEGGSDLVDATHAVTARECAPVAEAASAPMRETRLNNNLERLFVSTKQATARGCGEGCGRRRRRALRPARYDSFGGKRQWRGAARAASRVPNRRRAKRRKPRLSDAWATQSATPHRSRLVGSLSTPSAVEDSRLASGLAGLVVIRRRQEYARRSARRFRGSPVRCAARPRGFASKSVLAFSRPWPSLWLS